MNNSMEKDIKSENMILNFGPSHPATHGTLHTILELDGEKVIKATPIIGYLHRGVEKLAENRTYQQFIPLSDRLNYVSSLMNNIGYSLAVEKLLGIEAPIRCQYIRVILAELSRIADHLVSIGISAVDLGAFSVFLYAFKQREILYDIFEMTSGQRLTTTYTRTGGLAKDIPDSFIQNTRKFTNDFPKYVDEIENLLTRNKIWLQRTQEIGVISPDEAINWGFTGPCLRASGVNWDIRKAHPYSSYKDFEFDVPLGENGDVYDRYIVRMEEMRQSARIIQQALNKLPDGPVSVDNPHITLPPKEKVYTKMENLIYHFEIVMFGICPPPGEIYSCTEAANGELGFYIVSDGTKNPFRLRVRPPCFTIFSAFPKLIEGRLIADVVSILGSLNIIAGELDR